LAQLILPSGSANSLHQKAHTQFFSTGSPRIWRTRLRFLHVPSSQPKVSQPNLLGRSSSRTQRAVLRHKEPKLFTRARPKRLPFLGYLSTLRPRFVEKAGWSLWNWGSLSPSQETSSSHA